MDEKFLNIAYEEAIKAYSLGEVPVGCVIVNNNVIIGKGHNLKEKNKDATAHAEIIAIKEASKNLNDWRLNGCSIYITMKPCPMCMGAIRESRISKIIYVVDSDNVKNYYNDLLIVKSNILYKKCLMLLKSFFKEKR